MNSAKKQIAHKWNLTDFKSPMMEKAKVQAAALLKSLDDSIKGTTDTAKISKFKSEQAMYQAMTKNMETQMADAKGKTAIEFMNDGKYTANFFGHDEKGKWDIDASGKKLIIQTDGKQNKDTMNIATLTADNLALSKDSTSLTFSAAK